MIKFENIFRPLTHTRTNLRVKCNEIALFLMNGRDCFYDDVGILNIAQFGLKQFLLILFSLETCIFG